MPPSPPDRWRRVEDLFERALALRPRDRPAFLAREARAPDGAPDPALADEVRALLDADAEAGPYFERVGREIALADQVGVGARVGPYRITGRLGEGGMGTVYRAARADGAFDREVALKVFRAGGDVRRFFAERQTLARLDHPAIAQLYDGGVTRQGHPYFAMELVEGERITDYADRHGLGVDARLRLFVRVCEAVQFAHGRLVVHRDLKPSNVMVCAGDDGGPQVKLLDFGIAKVLDDPDLTVAGVAPRTPAYAAPEQVRGEEVTTATDVYALGVLLYEMLTGRRPYRLTERARAAFERAVLETEPTRPSTAVTEPAVPGRSTVTLPGPERLAKRLSGDLDQILLKALRKDPEARYASAEAFGRDVQRHLDGHPIEARPESVGYRVCKFVRRHRGAVALAALALVGLVGGLGAALWQASVASAQRDRAERAATFMVGLLGEFDPNRAAAGRLDAGAILDQAVQRVEAGLRGQPEVQALLYDHIGQTYQTYARFDDADRLLRRALALRRGLYGEGPEVAESLTHLAWLYFVRGEYARADSLYARALEAGGERPSAQRAASLEGLGLVRRALGDPEAGAGLVREALAMREAVLGPDDPETEATRSALATLLYTLGQHDEAARLFRSVLTERRRTLGTHLQTAQALTDYGAVLVAQGRLDAAEAAHREALAIRRDLLGGDHPHVAQSLSHLGWTLQARGRPDAATPFYREALRIRRDLLGSDHTAVANSLLLLGEALVLQGDDRRGLGLVAEAVHTFHRALGPDHRTTLAAELRQAVHLEAAGRPEASRPLAVRLGPRIRAAYGPDDPRTRTAEALLARLGARP